MYSFAIAEALVKANPSLPVSQVQATVRKITGQTVDGRTIHGFKQRLIYRASGRTSGPKLAGLKRSRNYQAGKTTVRSLSAEQVYRIAA